MLQEKELHTNAIQKATLPNGFTVVFEPLPWLASASFSLLLPVGATTDPDGETGSATVLNDLLYRGAGEYSSQSLSDALDALGVRRGGGAGKEYMTLSGSLLAESFQAALPIYADVVRRPHLDAGEFESARTLAEQELAALGDNPTQQLFNTLAGKYFVSAHGNSSYGDAAGLAALTPDSVRADYQRRVSPRGAILSVAGGLEWEAVRTLAEGLFGDWQAVGTDLPEVRVGRPHQDHLTEDTSQVQIGVAFGAAAPGAPGWYENALVLGVLGGGMGARLFTEVREKRGLVYSVAAMSQAVRGFGYTLAYAGTTTERANETLEVLLHELRRLADGVSEEELVRARTGLLSQLVMQGESSGARASALARDTFLLGAPRRVDEVKAALLDISHADLNRYLQTAYRPEFTVLTLGAKPLSEVTLA